MTNETYSWTDNPTVSGVSICDTDILNDCLMHLKYNHNPGDGFNLFDTKISDHILQGNEALGWALQGSIVTNIYPDAVEKIKTLYEEGVETTYRDISCKRSIDGRYIADISKYTEIDQLFEQSGVADFYILDTENNQFYLPKTKWFNQYTLDTSLVNKFNEAGLPNITGSTRNIAGIFNGASGALSMAYVDSCGIPGKEHAQFNLNFNAASSNPIYGKSSTVQPISSNKLLYYKVGSVIVNSDKALIDAQELLSDGLEELEQKISEGISGINSVSNSLRYNILTNRILEAPNGTAEYSNVGLTGTAVVEDGILSGISSSSSATIQSFQPGSSTWEAFFKVTTGNDTSIGSRIAVLNRTVTALNKRGGIHFGIEGGKFAWWMSTNGTTFNLASGQTGTHSIQSNTTYWVKVNWDGTKYTLAYSLTGDADSFVTDITKTSSTPLAFHPDSPEYAQIGTGAGAGAAGSLASIDLNSSYIKVNDEIWWEFNGTNPNQVVLKEGLKLLSAVGRNSDGTLNSTEYTLSEDIPCTVSSSDVGYKYIALDTSSSDVTVYENYFSQEETPEVSNAVWFKPSENRFYVSDAEGEFSQANIALFQVFKDKYGFFKGLYPDTAVNLATMDNVDGDWEVNQVVNLANGSSIPANTAAGGTVYTYDVSNYFPDDGCEYEIALSIEINNSAFVICYFWYPQTNNAIVFARGGNPTGGAMTAIVGLDRQIKISVASTQAARMWLYTNARKRLARKGA